MRRTLFILLFFLFPSIVYGADIHWVRSDGTATWGNCEADTDPGAPASNYCSLATANTNADCAGANCDTIKMKDDGGDYSTTITPSNSGSSTSNMITYEAASGETPVITGCGTSCIGINLEGNKDYIKVSGITFHTLGHFARLTAGSSYNEIDSCIFYNGTALTNVGITIADFYESAGGSNHNWVHDCTIYQGGYAQASPCDDKGYTMKVGAKNSDGASHHNTIEDNTIYYGGHHCLEVNGPYTIIRNNFMHNEGWLSDPGTCNDTYCYDPNDSKYGNRDLMVIDYGSYRFDDISYVLIENNRLGHTGLPVDGNGSNNLILGMENLIARYNTCYDAQEKGIYLRSGTSDSDGKADGMHIYNNTVYNGGSGPSCRYSVWPGFIRGGIYGCQSEVENNVLKNNIVYGTTGNPDIKTTNSTNTTEVNNWITSDGDPKFIDTDLTDPTSTTKPDLSLQSDSGCVNNGTYLTQANGSGSSSTTLIVDDPWYFQDGTWGSSLATLYADWIAVGTVGNTVQISSINYSTNTITLVDPITWSDDAYIWLSKDSSGNNVLYGSAPDQGAYEYSGPVSSGTVVPGTVYEIDVVQGFVLTITLSNETFDTDTLSEADEDNIVSGMDSDGSQTHGWDAEVKTLGHNIGSFVISTTYVTNDTLTITCSSNSSYSIDSGVGDETITTTLPASVLTGAAELELSTFVVYAQTEGSLNTVSGNKMIISAGTGTGTDKGITIKQ